MRKEGQDVPILTGCIEGKEEEVFIIDGHRRYRKLLSMNREPAFSPKVKTFSDIKEVHEWMLKNEELVRRERNTEGDWHENSH